MLLLALVLIQAAPGVPGRHPRELAAVAESVRALRTPAVAADGVPDYSAAAVARAKDSLRELRSRFDAIDSSGWPVHDRVDYLLVRSELDLLEYLLSYQRATSRNPNFYISSISSAGMLSGATLSRLGDLVSDPPPFDAVRAQRVLAHLRAIPRILADAQKNLTEPDYHRSKWALASLKGAREASRHFTRTLAPHFPAEEAKALAPAGESMGQALEEFERFLGAKLDTMTKSTPTGRALYDWLLARVWLLPFDAAQVREMGESELARFRVLTALEEARNTGVPKLTPAATTAEYTARTEAEEKSIRSFLSRTDALTIPAAVGPYRRAVMPEYMQAFGLWNAMSGYDTAAGGEVKYTVPETHVYSKTYWESIMRTDPSTNLFHDAIPGHHFQGILARQNACPIRRAHTERFKSEGWATYWEETALRLGYYDLRPRSRELILSYLRLRALRVIVDVRMALGEMTAEEATQLLMTTPMDRRIASEEADDFFAAPTGGLVYLVGKLQIERLLAGERERLGAKFGLRAYHDALMDAGWVPLALTRWELTGDDREVRRLFENRAPLPATDP